MASPSGGERPHHRGQGERAVGAAAAVAAAVRAAGGRLAPLAAAARIAFALGLRVASEGAGGGPALPRDAAAHEGASAASLLLAADASHALSQQAAAAAQRAAQQHAGGLSEAYLASVAREDAALRRFDSALRPPAMCVLMLAAWGAAQLAMHSARLDAEAALRSSYPGAGNAEHVHAMRLALVAASMWTCAVGVILGCEDMVGLNLWSQQQASVLQLVTVVALPVGIVVSAAMCAETSVRLRALGKSLARCVASPFVPTHFADGILADVLTSLAGAFHDAPLALCTLLQPFAASVGGWVLAPFMGASEGARMCLHPPLGVAALFLMWPFAIRLAQCARQCRDDREYVPFFNALKYCCAFPRGALQAEYARLAMAGSPKAPHVFKLWVAAAALASTYACLWDVRFDWDCVDFGGGLFAWRLRSTLGHFSRPAFRLALVWNAVARYAWLVWVLPPDLLLGASTRSISMALQATEIARRGVWVLFRLENATRGRALRSVESFALMPRSESGRVGMLPMGSGSLASSKTGKTSLLPRDAAAPAGAAVGAGQPQAGGNRGDAWSAFALTGALGLLGGLILLGAVYSRAALVDVSTVSTNHVQLFATVSARCLSRCARP